MTEPHHEPSYYEIALTNRQVVVAFAILLVCLLIAFFSGVWIGRGGAGASEEEVRASAQEAPREASALEEFEFFEEDEGSASTAAPAPSVPEPQDPPTLREDLEGAAPPDDEEAGEPEDVPEPVPPREREVPPPGEVRPQPPPQTAEPVRTPPGSAVIQVFSSAEQDQAGQVRDRLTAAGYKAYLSPVEVGGRTMYRVRIGPFTSRAKAQEVAERVRRSHRLDTWVTE